MNRTETVDAANVIQHIRPDWNQPGIIAALKQLPNLPYATILAHSVRIAGHPASRTPAAIAATPIAVTQAAAEPDPALGAQAPCDICGRSEVMCQRAQVNAIRLGNRVHASHPGRAWKDVDRHDYTPVRAEPVPLIDRSTEIERVAASHRLPDEPWLPADLAAETAARLEADELPEQEAASEP